MSGYSFVDRAFQGVRLLKKDVRKVIRPWITTRMNGMREREHLETIQSITGHLMELMHSDSLHKDTDTLRNVKAQALNLR